MRLRMIALGAIVALGGCARTLDERNIAKFNQATATLSTAVEATRDLNRKVVTAYYTEILANEYGGDEPPADDPKKAATYRFPPSIPEEVDFEKAWQVRIAYARALQGYGAALASAVASPDSSDIETAIGNLQNVVTTFAPSLLAQSGFDAASKIAVKAATAAIMQARDKKLREQIARAHPLIVAGRGMLAYDMGTVAKLTNDRYKEWTTERFNALAAIREDHRVSFAQRHAAYVSFTQDQQDMAASLQLLVPKSKNQQPGYLAVVDDLVAAHAKLLDAPDDPLAVDDFLHQIEAILQSLKSSS